MSSTPSPASSIAIRLARAARTETDVPELRVNSVQPIPAMAVWSLMGKVAIGFLLQGPGLDEHADPPPSFGWHSVEADYVGTDGDGLGVEVERQVRQVLQRHPHHLLERLHPSRERKRLVELLPAGFHLRAAVTTWIRRLVEPVVVRPGDPRAGVAAGGPADRGRDDRGGAQ